MTTDSTTPPTQTHAHTTKAIDAAILDLQTRLAAVEAKVSPPTTPAVTVTGTVVTPADNIPALLASGTRQFVLRGGTYRLGWGSVERTEAGVSLLPYPGEVATVLGAGLDPHFLYLGPGADWTLGIVLSGFVPSNSAVVAIGDACKIHTVAGFEIAGAGVAGDNTSHGLYFHGTGTGTLDDPYIHGVPGAALQTYRGTPIVQVNKGRLGGAYQNALIYSGSVAFSGTAFTNPAANWDVRANTVRPTLTACTGTGPNGTVRLFQD